MICGNEEDVCGEVWGKELIFGLRTLPPPILSRSTTNSTTTTPPPHLTKQDLTELKCHAVDDGAPRLPKDPEYTARVLETAQYEWNTTNGCKKYAFDRMAFAKRCLRAKAGVT
jgi:hypothetical protein